MILDDLGGPDPISWREGPKRSAADSLRKKKLGRRQQLQLCRSSTFPRGLPPGLQTCPVRPPNCINQFLVTKLFMYASCWFCVSGQTLAETLPSPLVICLSFPLPHLPTSTLKECSVSHSPVYPGATRADTAQRSQFLIRNHKPGAL